jgi:hypothetical protein
LSSLAGFGSVLAAREKGKVKSCAAVIFYDFLEPPPNKGANKGPWGESGSGPIEITDTLSRQFALKKTTARGF